MVGIKSIGWWIPSARSRFSDLGREYGLNTEVFEKSGFFERADAGPDDHPCNMAVRATRSALQSANMEAEDLDLLIYVGVTKDWPAPWVAAFGVLHELGTTSTVGFDLSTRCSGGLDALWLAKTLIDSGTYHNIAICCVERFDYLMTAPWVPESALDLVYAAGAACVIVTPDAENSVTAYSNCINPDLSLHRVLSPLAGGTRMPMNTQAVDQGAHHWHRQFTVGQFAQMMSFQMDADRYNYKLVMQKANFDEVDFVVCSPVEPEPQIKVLAELGIGKDKLLFSIPYLGHIGAADLFLILGIAIANKRPIGTRIILSSRIPAYTNAIGLQLSEPNNPGIQIAGEGIDLSLWEYSIIKNAM